MTALQFRKEILEVGLTEANFEAFNAEGLNTMGIFAFACNYAPGVADERPLTTLATNVLGAAPFNQGDGLHHTSFQ